MAGTYLNGELDMPRPQRANLPWLNIASKQMKSPHFIGTCEYDVIINLGCDCEMRVQYLVSNASVQLLLTLWMMTGGVSRQRQRL